MANLEKHPESEAQLAEDFEKKMGKSKAWDILQDSVTRFWTRQEILNLLRERHRLTVWECMNERPEVVRERQAAYDADLEKFKAKWKEEDADCNKT
jgi:hypothetical protein